MQRYVFTSPRVQVASFPPAEALVPEIGVFIIGPHAPYIVEAEDAERSPDEIHIEIDQLQAKLRISEETAPSGEARLPKATKILPAAERVRLVEGKVAEVRRTPCPQGKWARPVGHPARGCCGHHARVHCIHPAAFVTRSRFARIEVTFGVSVSTACV